MVSVLVAGTEDRCDLQPIKTRTRTDSSRFITHTAVAALQRSEAGSTAWMPLRSLVRQLQDSALSGELLERSRRTDRLLMRGAGRCSRALIASALAKRDGHPLLVVVPTLEEAGRWTALLDLMGWDSAGLYPTSEGSPYGHSIPPAKSSVCPVLSDLLGDPKGVNKVIVATERCLQPHLPPPQALADQCRTLKWRRTRPRTTRRTTGPFGYERVSSIDQRALRADEGTRRHLPVSSELPVRLEFFGEESTNCVSSTRQPRSLDAIEQLRLTPTGFSPLIADRLRDQMPEGLERLLGEQATEILLEGGTPEGMRRLMGLAWNQPASLLDYLPERCCVVIDERRHGLAHGQQWLDHATDHHQEMAAELGSARTNGSSLAWRRIEIAEAYQTAEALKALIWRNCSRRTPIPTASTWPADRCRPTPISSANSAN